MSTNETKMMSEKIREMRQLEQLIAEAEAEVEAIKDMLKAKMTEENTERMTVDIYEVRWTTVKSDRIDTTAFKKAMPDVAQQFVKTTTSRRFSIA